MKRDLEWQKSDKVNHLTSYRINPTNSAASNIFCITPCLLVSVQFDVSPTVVESFMEIPTSTGQENDKNYSDEMFQKAMYLQT